MPITKHGDSKRKGITKLYFVWGGMKSRCFNQNFHEFHYYGGRGITVCKEWLNDYPAFKEWALENGYQEGLIIDRIDNNGDYEPGNCRFVTAKVSQNNRRGVIYLTAFGETKTQGEWAADPRCQVAHHTLHARINEYGWDAERAISTKAQDQNKRRK